MKRILFPATFRGHLARQKLLLQELKKDFGVDIWEPKIKNKGRMSANAILYAAEFNDFLASKNYDAVLIRGDRYELLGITMVSAYRDIPIIHIEGGDESGVIDNKVRHAITQLADYHFVTNEESHKKIIAAGISPNKVWNYGSLDVEFANSVSPIKTRENYILVAYHPIEKENYKEVERALGFFIKNFPIIVVSSNSDYRQKFGEEEYSPEEYINLIRFASCLVGNSSSFLKEASIFGVPVVNVGSRQLKRLKPKNVLDVPCESEKIKTAIEFQLKNKYSPDYTYFQEKTSEKIANRLKEIL